MPDIWAVEVSYDDEDPATYGPYTEGQAERVASRIMGEIALSRDSYGGNHHPHGAYHAAAFRPGRYDQFLTGKERWKARKDARRAERDAAERAEDL